MQLSLCGKEKNAHSEDNILNAESPELFAADYTNLVPKVGNAKRAPHVSRRCSDKEILDETSLKALRELGQHSFYTIEITKNERFSSRNKEDRSILLSGSSPLNNLTDSHLFTLGKVLSSEKEERRQLPQLAATKCKSNILSAADFKARPNNQYVEEEHPIYAYKKSPLLSFESMNNSTPSDELIQQWLNIAQTRPWTNEED